MTNKTYNQLWWDEEFVRKRIQEQRDYIKKYKSTVDKNSAKILGSAFDVLDRFNWQLAQIQKLKGHCCRY